MPLLQTPERVTKLKRAFLWIQRMLEITQRTDVPESIDATVRPGLDMLGWDRLPEEIFLSTSSGAPTVAVASATPPVDVVRLVLNASLEHTDTGVNHIAWMVKRRNPGSNDVGIPTDRTDIDRGEFLSMQGMTFLINNDFIVAEIIGAPLVGAITLRLIAIDLPRGEYIPFL